MAIESGILIFIVIEILVSAVLLKAFLKSKGELSKNLSSFAIGYGVCVAICIFIWFMTIILPVLWFICYSILFVPLMFFSFMLNRRILQTKTRHFFVNFAYKVIATFLIWFLAFFPFSLIGITEIINMPAKNAIKREILKFQEEVLGYETYADLTPFGLGIYKLHQKGDIYLWDVTKPKDHVIHSNGFYLVFEHHLNRKNNESWDDSWGNSNRGKDVMYDVFYYNGTYLIVTPIWERHGTLYYWGYIYLCKEIDENADLFDIGILDPDVVESLKELPGEKLSRKELAEKLNKAY